MVLLRFDAEHLAELVTLAETGAAGRPPLVVIGPPGSAEATRPAIRAGTRDFLFEPVKADELVASLVRVGREHEAPRRSGFRAARSMRSSAPQAEWARRLSRATSRTAAVTARRSCVLVDMD